MAELDDEIRRAARLADERREREVARRARRKRLAREAPQRPVWFGLGMFGLVGWAVALPTLAGLALGLWLDRIVVGSERSWTLTLLAAGVCLGCAHAWYWIQRELDRT